MHICLKCGRAAQSVDEITEGCTCGSKVFVFKRCDGKCAKPVNSNPPTEPAGADCSKKPQEPDALLPAPANSSPQKDVLFPVSPNAPGNPAFKNNNSNAYSAPANDAKEGAVPGPKIFPPLSEDNGEKKPSSVASAILGEEMMDDEPGHDYSEVWLSKGAKISSGEPGSQVENIKQIRSGVFEVDLLGVKTGPLVVKDEDGVYYVRLPFSQPQLSDDEKL